MNEKIINIAITGPESTGKSQLAGTLANHYNADWVSEYARIYLAALERPYDFDDILHIAKQQQQFIRDAMDQSTGRFLFFDTELTVARIWCEYKYARCHDWILEHHQKQQFDLYLLLDIDLTWQPDPLREHPDKRKELFDMYERVLQNEGWPYAIVSGEGDKRTENAIQILEERF